MRSKLTSIALSALIIGAGGSALANVPPLSTQYGSYVEPISRNVKVTKQAPVTTTIPSGKSITPSTEEPVYVPSKSLLTGTALEIGAQFSDYSYEEPSDGLNTKVNTDGSKYGLIASVSRSFNETWYAKGEGRFAYGKVDYEGSGTHENEEDFITEVRLLGGKDFLFNRFSISPQTGIGYRYLSNDGRGTTSTGAKGYRRESQYIYLPIGFRNRIAINDISRIHWGLEYDQLLWGKQISELGDTSRYYGRLNNYQHSGYGFRGDIMYERNSWSVGPFFNYWDISKSDDACSVAVYNGTRYVSCGWVEPDNNTTEFGIQVKYRIF